MSYRDDTGYKHVLTRRRFYGQGHTLVNAPLVSILTPSLDQGRWLTDNLRSVAAQTYSPLEHVVIDGGSTDDSLDVLAREAGPHVVWKSEPDKGQSDAINKAFAQSRGEIVGWLNSDDAYFSPSVVSEVVDVFRENPDVGVVYGHAVLADQDGLVLQALWAPTFRPSLLRLHDFIIQPTAFVRRSIIDRAFVDDTYEYTMDYELWLRLAKRHPFRRIDRIVAVDRHHLTRKSYTMMTVGRADHERLVRAYGVAGGIGATVLRKAWKVLSRLAGVRLLRAALSDTPAFGARRDGGAWLLLRQVAIPRALMKHP